MKLKLNLKSNLLILVILAVLSPILPYLIITKTSFVNNGEYFWLLIFELIMLTTVCFLWYKMYYEVIRAEIKDGYLVYRNLYFLKRTIDIKDIKGFKVGHEESDFFVLFDTFNKKIFVIRMDFYSNYYDFIDELKIENMGVYRTLFQKIIDKIINK